MGLKNMPQWFWGVGGGVRGEGNVDPRNGLQGKLGAVQRQRWKRGQDAVYMTLCNSLCQLLPFAASHFLHPTVQQ